MKNSSKVLMALSLISLLFITCAKEIEQIENTQLLITLRDSAEILLPGVPVKLYKSLADTGITQTTDSLGRTLFSDLEPIQYYWLAEIGCRNNLADQFTLNRPLIRGSVLYGNSVVSATGIIKITNTTGLPYRVTDSALFNIVLNDTPFVAYRKTGSYRIHSERLNMPATRKDSLVQIHCGDTSFLTIPY